MYSSQRKDKGVRIVENRVNREITAPELLVIDDCGKQLGIRTLYEALRLAEDAELDLVEVGPGASPPVAKILDYSKYRYELEKKQTGQKKSSETKEVRLSLEIGDHDWNVKLNKAKKFLADNGRVRVSLRLAGRQMLFAGKAVEKINSFRQALGAQYETRPQRLGQKFNAILNISHEKQD